jgi:hypothetical protein
LDRQRLGVPSIRSLIAFFPTCQRGGWYPCRHVGQRHATRRALPRGITNRDQTDVSEELAFRRTARRDTTKSGVYFDTSQSRPEKIDALKEITTFVGDRAAPRECRKHCSVSLGKNTLS